MRRVRLGNSPVRVPRPVLDGLEAVRRSGLTNMFDRPAVIEIAEMLGFNDAAAWAQEHRDEYATGIFCGFSPEGEGA